MAILNTQNQIKKTVCFQSKYSPSDLWRFYLQIRTIKIKCENSVISKKKSNNTFVNYIVSTTALEYTISVFSWFIFF